MPVSRETLYREIWAEAMTTVAARYDVSSSFLARVCERLGVPRPARGYWAQLVVGKAPAKPALPAARPGDELEWSRDGDPRRAPRALPQPPEDAPRSKRRPSNRSPSQHQLLLGARAHFEAAKESDHGYLRPLKKLLVDVFVSKKELDRALALANELFLSLENRGHRVVFGPRDQPYHRPTIDERVGGGAERYSHQGWCPARPTVVFIGSLAIGLTIFEFSERIEVQYVNGKYIPTSQLGAARHRALRPEHTWTHERETPTGRLCLRASSPYTRAAWEKQWHEARPGDLLGSLSQIIRALETEAPTVAALLAEGERQAAIEREQLEQQHQKWLREEAERRRVKNLKDSRQDLFAIIEEWGVAKRIEAFFDDTRQAAERLGQNDGDWLVDRLRRARDLLGGTDALERFRSWTAPDER